MNKQDRVGVRTAQDIERKYNFSELVGIKKAVEHNEETLNKTNTELENFMRETLENLEAIDNKLDGQITTYYYSGVPTLSNYPVSEWSVEDYESHIGDLYYDKETSYAYKFLYDNETGEYLWVEEKSSEVTEALELAQQAQDTADGKRRVFVTTPFVPYDEGDLWLRNKELYVCIISKTTEGTYSVSDFEKATKYTDDSGLNNFVDQVYTKQINDLNSLINTKITTWYYSGIPTLENAPANEWTTGDMKLSHVGDLYYDKSTGYTYRFNAENNTYNWEHITDKDIVEALTIANDSKDTADSKRRVFTTTPFIPYDEGDLWINNEELYICQTSSTTEYNSSHFKKATKYTDDTALNTFISGDYADDLEEINETIDKKAETWYQATNPATTWTTTELKNAHIGDLWFNTSENKNYIYTSSHEWKEADGVPDSVYDEIDGKAQIFTSQPTTPYYKGDLYTQGTNGDILVCTADRLTGSYTASDWTKAGKYTDDTALNDFVEVTYKSAIEELNESIDSKITTWYYSGVPTLSNTPANSWTTNELKAKHEGDLYYDKSTGKAYIFQLNSNVYGWWLVEDKDIEEALELASISKDTADSKRRVFTDTPYSPYDEGDLWFNNKEIYICQTSKPEGANFANSDFAKATIYTDDTNLNNFVNTVYPNDLASLTSQIDGKMTTWYLSGVPTLENAPASDWTEEDYIKHTGDLYYDKETGYTYTFQKTEGVYGWVHIIDSDLTDALAKANAAKDTADNKRRVFVDIPEPPYDNGDLWISEQEIYVCQIAKAEGETYEENDFIIATKYTDDTLANKVGENLEVLRGTVLEVQRGVDEYKIEFETSITAIHNETKETTEALETMSYSFGTKELKIANSDDPVNATFNNRGVKVYTYKDLSTIMNEKGLGTNKLIVVQEAQIGNLRINKAVDENNKACTDFHHLISTIQDITDLE